MIIKRASNITSDRNSRNILIVSFVKQPLSNGFFFFLLFGRKQNAAVIYTRLPQIACWHKIKRNSKSDKCRFMNVLSCHHTWKSFHPSSRRPKLIAYKKVLFKWMTCQQGCVALFLRNIYVRRCSFYCLLPQFCCSV